MGEYLIASFQFMPTVSMKYKKAWFIILDADEIVVAIDWKDSKVVAITALEICVFTEMVHGESWTRIATEKTLMTIHMDVLFVWSHFLLDLYHQ